MKARYKILILLLVITSLYYYSFYINEAWGDSLSASTDSALSWFNEPRANSNDKICTFYLNRMTSNPYYAGSITCIRYDTIKCYTKDRTVCEMDL
jgi:hypothetical protein